MEGSTAIRRWTIANRSDGRLARVAWATGAAAVLLLIAAIPACAATVLCWAYPTGGGWAVVVASAVFGLLLVHQLASTARLRSRHAPRRKHVALLSWMLLFLLSLQPFTTGLAAGFAGDVDGSQALLFLLDNLMKVALLDTFEVFDVNLASIRPADHVARLYTLSVRVVGATALIALGLTVRRESQADATFDGDEESLRRAVGSLILPSRQSVTAEPIIESVEEFGPDEGMAAQAASNRALGWGCAAGVLIVMAGFGLASRFVGLFGNFVGSLYGFPTSGTVVVLGAFGAFGLLLLVGLLFNVRGVLLPPNAEYEETSANTLMVTSAGLVWVLVMLLVVPGSPFAAGLTGDGNRQLIQLLAYVMDNLLNVVLLDVPDIWGWSLSGLEAQSSLTRAFAVGLRFTMAWGVLRIASANMDGAVGARVSKAES